MSMELVTSRDTKKAALKPKGSKDAENRLKVAREAYRQMQKNWFIFAKEIREIRDSHDHDIFGVESFQKLCEREFPLASYSTISKFIQIVEKLGDQIEVRLKKDDYLLPTYETCYQLTTVESKIKTEEYSKLKKQILDEKITVKNFRDKLKDMLGVAKRELSAKIDHETEEYIEKTQRELDEELKADRGWEDEEEADDEDYEAEDVDLDEVDVETRSASASEATVVGLSSRIDYLIDNLPEFVEQIDTIDAPVKKLLKKLKELGGVIDETVETLET
jgi:hypothetical protein